MKNADMPANAQFWHPDMGVSPDSTPTGLTKREYACIELRIPASGDAELDALIRKSIKQGFAVKALQGVISYSGEGSPNGLWDVVAKDALKAADALLEALDND